MTEYNDLAATMEKIEDVTGLRDAARKLLHHVLDTQLPWYFAGSITDDGPPGVYVCDRIREPVKQLREKARRLEFGGLLNLSDREVFVQQLIGLIEWAEPKIGPVLEFKNGEKLEEKDVPAEFREGRKADGEPLTPEYFSKETVKWNVGRSPSWFSKNYREGKKLTKRFPIGNTYAYSFDELSAISRLKDEETDRRE